jgi:hypothetical protein
MGYTAKAQPPPATEAQAVPFASGSRSRHPPACVGIALIDRRFQGGFWYEAAQAHGADIPEVSTSIPG